MKQHEPDPEPPPPGGILWDIAGEARSLLALPAALTLQVAHPAVGAACRRALRFPHGPVGSRRAVAALGDAVGLRR